MTKQLFVGIDVSETHGFDLVALCPRQGFVEARNLPDADATYRFLKDNLGGPSAIAAVAVDSPCNWAYPNSRSREAERALEINGHPIQSYRTPSRELAVGQARLGWIRNGMALYSLLKNDWPLFNGTVEKDAPVVMETFPHAVSCYLSGERVRASSTTRTVLAGLATGCSLESLLVLDTKDLVDAALCSIAAIALHRGEYHMTNTGYPHGNSEEGFIVLPKQKWRLCPHSI